MNIGGKADVGCAVGAEVGVTQQDITEHTLNELRGINATV